MNKFLALLKDEDIPVVTSPKKRNYIGDIRSHARSLQGLKEQSIVLFTNYIYALIFPSLVPGNNAVVAYIDVWNNNLLFIHSDAGDLPSNRPLTFDSMVPTTSDPIYIYREIVNRVLPNFDDIVTDSIYDLIQAVVTGQYPTNHTVAHYESIARVVNESREPMRTVEFHFPRHNDNIYDLIKDIFSRYNVKESIPADIYYNREKVWTFAGSSEYHPGHYLEIEIRHAVRQNDPGIEIRVIAAGFKRRIFNYSHLIAAAA